MYYPSRWDSTMKNLKSLPAQFITKLITILTITTNFHFHVQAIMLNNLIKKITSLIINLQLHCILLFLVAIKTSFILIILPSFLIDAMSFKNKAFATTIIIITKVRIDFKISFIQTITTQQEYIIIIVLNERFPFANLNVRQTNPL